MTADNYIIFNNLIIGQTANDHTAGVNMHGQRIELQFLLMRLITHCICSPKRCLMQMKATRQERARGCGSDKSAER